MKKHAQKILKNPLIYGTSIVMIGNLIANFMNFLFSVFMAQSLSVADNGILASIISMITFPALLANAVNPVVIRFAGGYFVNNELNLVKGLYLKFAKFFLIVGIISFFLFLLFMGAIGDFFHIKNYSLLFLANIIMLLFFLNILNTSFLQAKLAFGYSVFVNFTAAVAKFILGVVFISLGYSVLGAVGALVASAIVAYIIGFIPLRFIFKKNFTSPKINTVELFKYGIPSALTLVGLTSFISVDILFTKHFFDPTNAGLYAGLSLVGRIIFYLTVPIGGVMFPIIVRKHAGGENYSNTFKLAALFVMGPCLLITLVYFLFPQFVILFVLKKTAYLAIAPYLGFFGLYITLYCFLYLMATFYLSIKKTNVFVPVLVGALLQMVLIYNFHENFFQIILISFILVLLLVISFLLYYPYAKK